MLLVKLENVSLAFGLNPLLDQTNFQIEGGERVCIVGRNGAGKSSLLKLIQGSVVADSGEVWRAKASRIAYLEQDVPDKVDTDVYSVIAAGLENVGELLAEYHHLSLQMMESDDPVLLTKMGDLQQQLEHEDAWSLEQKVEAIASRLELNLDVSFSSLSGGLRRRVLLARALISEPDLLLLDEPTNHLDINSIQWLEDFLLQFTGAIMFVTHDRTFLQNMATRIVELDRGMLTSYPQNYINYLEAKQEALEIEERHNKQFDKKLAQEEVWIRQGIKARRTRNEGRVRALKALREEHGKRRNVQGKIKLNLGTEKSSGKIVIDAENVRFAYDDKKIVNDFSIKVMRGDRIGIVGANGSGKSTLIKLLLGQLAPLAGKIELGTNLDILYFDQQREQLDPTKNLIDNLGLGSSTVTVNGTSRHVVGYLKDFLFSPERLQSPVSSLSGGEKNRLLLARLFTKSCNFLVLDEPTNDLDVESLELLEELISDFPGTLMVVSHDRAFLDNVVTSTLILDGEGNIEERVGGYSDWKAFLAEQTSSVSSNQQEKEQLQDKKNEKSGIQQIENAKKLSYKEKQELETLPQDIEKLELEKSKLEDDMADGDFYQQEKEKITKCLNRLEEIGKTLDEAYVRWEELEQRQ